jgi:hypothetical protein
MKRNHISSLAVVTLGSAAIVAMAGVAIGREQRSSGQYAHTQLVGRAVLPAATFRESSAPSGSFVSAADRTTTTNNGITVAASPAPAFGAQPIQGVSAFVPAGNGEWWAMSDNGFGARNNSADTELWVNRVKPDFAASGDGNVAITGGFGLSDPKGLIPWRIVCDPTKGASLPDFDFNRLPETVPTLCGGTSRKLTGFDFDIESMQIGRDGSFWFGEEFGPFLLHTNSKGELLEAPIALPGIKSPQNPTIDLASGEQPNLAASRGYEGMSISPDRKRLYPLLEGPVAADDQRDLRISEFDIERGRFTGRVWKVRLELRGAKVNLTGLRKSDGSLVYPGTVAPPAGLNAIGELTMINERQAILIERDNGGDSPNIPRFKKLFMLGFDNDRESYVSKTMMADLMAIPDPNDVGKDGAYFRFPFVTIESVYPIDDHTLAVVNDNNFPFSNGRSFSKGGPLAADANEFVLIGFDQKWNQDRRLVGDPIIRRESRDDDNPRGERDNDDEQKEGRR